MVSDDAHPLEQLASAQAVAASGSGGVGASGGGDLDLQRPYCRECWQACIPGEYETTATGHTCDNCVAKRPPRGRFRNGGASASSGSAVPAAAGAAAPAAVPAQMAAEPRSPPNPQEEARRLQLIIAAEMKANFANELRAVPGAPRPQLTPQQDAAWHEVRNLQSDQAIGRYVRQTYPQGILPPAAFVPPPAVFAAGIHVQPQPQRNPWESLVEAGVPASTRGDAAAARRNQEFSSYMSHFKGHPSVPASKKWGPNNPPPPPPQP